MARPTLLDCALRYSERGWPAFPLAPRSKRPCGELAPHGVKDATCDPFVLREWFDGRDDLGIGLACGVRFVALDVDPRNGGDVELAAAEAKYGPLPRTPRQITGGGGSHYLFVPPASPLKNGRLRGFRGLEIKTVGGYIVAAPSIHPDTLKAYRWDPDALPSCTALAPMPEWIVGLAKREERAAEPEAAERESLDMVISHWPVAEAAVRKAVGA